MLTWECLLCFCLVYTLKNVQSHNLNKKNGFKLEKSNNTLFKKPFAEKKLAFSERRASKVNISEKVRPFCGINIKCINNIIKKVRPLLMCFRNNVQGGASANFHKYIPTIMILNKNCYLIQCNELFLWIMLLYATELFVPMPSIDHYVHCTPFLRCRITNCNYSVLFAYR